jgi:predicted RNA-binding protein associated with RNAse of E/G family
MDRPVAVGNAGTNGFPIATRDTLPVFDLVYCRPPDRVSHIPTQVLSIDKAKVRWLNELAPRVPLRFDAEVVLDRGFWAVWFIDNGASYDLGKIYGVDGRHTGYYIDVLEPVRWQGDDLATIEPLTDLFLDLWVTPDGRCQVLDEPEFEEAEAQGRITPAQAAHARRTLAHLVDLARAGTLVPPEARSFELRF